MNMPEVRCYLCLETGKVMKLPPGDQGHATIQSEPTRYAAVEAIPSRIQYQWLDEFIKSIEDDTVRARMEAAINGKGAFRRFKDILLTLPEERRRWFEYRDVAMRTRISDWVREQGVEPINEPPWTEEGREQARLDPDNDTNTLDGLRDYLIAWADGRNPEEALTPLSLESLAQSIGEQFSLKAKD